MSTKDIRAKLKTRSFPRLWLSPFVKALFTALFSAVMSKITLFGTSSPFGVAAALSFPEGQLILSCLGAIWGYCSGFTAFSSKYTVAIIIGGLTKFVLSKIKRLSGSSAAAISAFSSLLICGFVAIRESFTVINIALISGEIFLAAGSCYIISSALPFFQNPFSKISLSKKDNATVLVTFSLLIASVSQLEFYGYSLGRALCVYFILLTGLFGNEAFSAVFGISCGIAIALTSPNLMFTALMYPLCSLLCGLFSGGKMGTVGAYILGCVLSLIYTGINDTVFAVLYETLLACAFFIITPATLVDSLSSFFFSSNIVTPRHGIVKKLDNTSAGLSEVASTIRKVGKNLERINAQDITSVFDGACDTVCTRCGLKTLCWVENYNDTLDLLTATLPALKQHNRILTSDLPQLFKEHCAKPSEMVAAINKHYSIYEIKLHGDSNSADMRKMLADQFDALSDVFKEIKTDYSQKEYNDVATAERVRHMFEGEHLEVTDCRCLIKSQGAMRLEIDFVSDEDICINRENLSERLYDICGRSFGPPNIEAADNLRRIVINERVNFKAEFSAVCMAAGSNKLCGDSYDYLLSDDGRAVAMISDGMGSGGLAAIESKMAVSLLSKLIKYGFSYSSALSIVNWSLMAKSKDEMLATLDLLSVDLYTGETNILKAGAPSSFIRRGENIQEIEFASSPIGILKNVSFESNKIKLRDGDLAVLVSDGAIMGDSDWLKHEIRMFDGNLDSFVKNLAAKAKARRPTGQDDDVTVMAVMLKSA